MRWPAFLTRRPPAALPAPPPAAGLARFDTATPAELASYPRRLRNKIIADRKRRVTADLQRYAAKLDALAGEVA